MSLHRMRVHLVDQGYCDDPPETSTRWQRERLARDRQHHGGYDSGMEASKRLRRSSETSYSLPSTVYTHQAQA